MRMKCRPTVQGPGPQQVFYGCMVATERDSETKTEEGRETDPEREA